MMTGHIKNSRGPHLARVPQVSTLALAQCFLNLLTQE